MIRQVKAMMTRVVVYQAMMTRVVYQAMMMVVYQAMMMVVLFLHIPTLVVSLPDGLHPTPPMGWTSWNTFFEYNSQEKMISQMDALLELGLDRFGYRYLTIDDRWHLPDRDNMTGRMVEDPDKFPDGIKFLTDYAHDRGLLVGLYSSAGLYTCSGFLPGSLGHEETDVGMLVDYQVDYFKYDNCWPRLDGTTNIGDGGVNIDLPASMEHYPSLWQDPSEESRYAVLQVLVQQHQRDKFTLWYATPP